MIAPHPPPGLPDTTRAGMSGIRNRLPGPSKSAIAGSMSAYDNRRTPIF
jgi:hypothetical protein